jgi:ABC-type transport system involved in multi-copper enzyme maturation permease subunit
MSSSAPDRPASPAAQTGRVGEVVGLTAWLFAAAAWIAWYVRGDSGFGPMHLATLAGLVLALAVLARRGWLKLFGPVLFYEGLRASRRGRFFLLRWLYAIGLLLLLLWVHSIWRLEQQYSRAPEQPYKQQAKLAQEFFFAFAVVQFTAVVLLTPAYVAGGIAEEKEKRTLEFLLATDLRGREIVFGKLLARLGNLGLFVITGLPVLSLMQFFGGIDPGLLLAVFAATALTACSLAALGVLMSVQRRRARDAIILTYLVAAGYAAIASLTLAVPPLWAAYHLELARQGKPNATADVPYYNEIETTVEWFNAGNPFYAVGKVASSFGRGRTVGPVLGEALEHYAIFHSVVTAAFVGLALVRLRPVALAQAGAPANRKKRRFALRVRRRRPPVGTRPMVWKEVRIEGGLRFGWFGRVLIALIVGISFVPFVIMVYEIFFDPTFGPRKFVDGWSQLREGTRVWVAVVNTIVSTLMLLGVAVRAAGSVGGERDRDTLTSLMTSTLTTGEIVWAKLVGSLMSVRLLLVWLSVVWAIGLVTGGVNLLCVPLQCIAWLFPAMFVGSLGLYFSAACKTTLRAITWTVFGALIALGGHWVCVGMGCYLPLSAMNYRDREFEWMLKLEAGLTPPFLFAVVPVENPEEYSRHNNEDFLAWAVVAQFIWVVAALPMWHRAHMKFRRLTNRVELASPAGRVWPPTVLAAADDADES